MVTSFAVILVCTSGAKQTNGEAARAVICFAPEMTTTVRCFRALPTVMVTASITFKRLLNSPVYSGHEMEITRNSCPLNARKTTDNLFCNIQMTWNRYPVILRFKLVNCFGLYKYQFEFRTISFVRKSELGTVSLLKTPNLKYRRQFSIFKCIFKKFILIIAWSFIINYRIRAMYIRTNTPILSNVLKNTIWLKVFASHKTHGTARILFLYDEWIKHSTL